MQRTSTHPASKKKTSVFRPLPAPIPPLLALLALVWVTYPLSPPSLAKGYPSSQKTLSSTRPTPLCPRHRGLRANFLANSPFSSVTSARLSVCPKAKRGPNRPRYDSSPNPASRSKGGGGAVMGRGGKEWEKNAEEGTQKDRAGIGKEDSDADGDVDEEEDEESNLAKVALSEAMLKAMGGEGGENWQSAWEAEVE
eukprot:1372809-Amorphochlora_amoeboformis.AAC.1